MKEVSHLAVAPWMLDGLQRRHARAPFDLVYERLSLWSDVGVRLAEATGVPLIVEMNAPLAREQARYRNLALGEAAGLLEERTLLGADRVIVVSRPLAGELASRSVDGSRVRVLPNIAESRAYRRTPLRPPAPGEPLVLGFSGSLKPWHGLGGFLPVLEAVLVEGLPVRLEIAGDGPERRALENEVEERGLRPAVRFLGHLEHAAVARWLDGIHLAVAPYPLLDDFYFSPLKIAEALAAGRPVMASRLGDIPAMLDDGSAGLLLPAGDPASWTEALRRVVREPQTLVPLARRAAALSAGWSWTRQVERTLEGMVPAGEGVGSDVPS